VSDSLYIDFDTCLPTASGSFCIVDNSLYQIAALSNGGSEFTRSGRQCRKVVTPAWTYSNCGATGGRDIAAPGEPAIAHFQDAGSFGEADRSCQYELTLRYGGGRLRIETINLNGDCA
jgi:hypothetical protein